MSAVHQERYRRRSAIAAAFAAALLITAVPPASARFADEFYSCEQEVAETLARLAVPPQSYAGISYRERYGRDPFRRDREIVGIEAWVDLEPCQGYLVISLTQFCYPSQAYTTEQCRVPGLARY